MPTARLTLVPLALGLTCLVSAPAFAQTAPPACSYPFDCPVTPGTPIADGGTDAASGGGVGIGTGVGAGGDAGATAPTRVSNPRVLPFTGGDVALVGLTGAAALAAGGALVVAGRRRGARD